MNKETNKFWHIRSANYDKLYWVKDKDYLDVIIKATRFKKSDIVLDVGTGTGIVAKKIKPLVKYTLGIDVSNSMLEKGRWVGISVIRWDIREKLFVDNLFDKIIARMVFHHILNNLNKAIRQCYDMLRNKGKLIVAEGVPPSNDKKVIDWYTSMFELKEKRRIFTPEKLAGYLKKNGFRNIKTQIYMMDNFSIRNWLKNSGLSEEKQHKIMRLHVKASKKIRDIYQMKFLKDDCIVRTKNAIIIAEK